MKRLVQTIALGAAVVALALGVWRDYGPYTAFKQAAAAYLVAYFLSAGVGLAGKAALHVLRDPEPPPEPDAREVRRQKRKQAAAHSAPAAGTAAPAAAPAASPPAPVEASKS